MKAADFNKEINFLKLETQGNSASNNKMLFRNSDLEKDFILTLKVSF